MMVKINDRLRRRSAFGLRLLVALGLMLMVFGPAPASLAAGTITGTVFQDFNGNGQRDTSTTVPNDGGVGSIGLAVDGGVGSVTVTAYDSAGVVQGTTTTAANGQYTLVAGGTGPYRVEFTNLPAGFEPGPYGANSLSTVQFVPDGNTGSVDVGLNVPADYCQNNPLLATTCFVYGSQITGTYNLSPTLVTFPYSAGSARTTGGAPNTDYQAPTTHATMIPANQLGTAYGLDYQRTSGLLYTSAYMKRHSGFGPGGIGAIYAVDPGANTASVYTNLDTLFGAGTTGPDLHDYSNFLQDYLTSAGPITNTWDAVGKTSLGALVTSDDDTRLYVINLFDRQLYSVPLTAPPTVANTLRNSVPLNPPGCPSAGDVRPFAVTTYRGLLYVGLICSAESTQNPADLQGHVYTANPASLAFSPVPVFSFPLNYPRGDVEAGASAAWRPWSPAFQSVVPGTTVIYPQPLFTDIAFDGGNLIIGLRDRLGDQAGNDAQSNPGDPTNLYLGITGGDVLRACGSPGTGWTLESNGRCAGLGLAPQGTGQGPGGAEYYFNDNYNQLGDTHDEVTVAGVTKVAGYPHVVVTTFDPTWLPLDTPNFFFTGGMRWYANATGAFAKGYELIGNPPGAPRPLFGKANGLGGLTSMCNAAPVEIGNRVWYDLNQNGVQDPDEAPVPGITVRLYDSTGALIGTAVTDARGDYYFSSAPGTNQAHAQYGLNILFDRTYTVRLDNPANYQSGGPLFNYVLTIPDSTLGSGSDLNDSDGISTTNPIGSPVGTWPVLTYTVGGPGQNNHTLDFGFYLDPTPVELLYFNVNGLGSRQVGLTWETAMELDNFGFYLYRAPARDFALADRIHFEPSALPGGSGSGAAYAYTDTVPSDGQWWYWLSDVDTNGFETFHADGSVTIAASGAFRLFLPLVGR